MATAAAPSREDFAAMLEESFEKGGTPSEGTVVNGKVVGIEKDMAVIDVVRRESLRRQWFDSQQTVACNFAHPPEQRAARWILMTQDQSAATVSHAGRISLDHARHRTGAGPRTVGPAGTARLHPLRRRPVTVVSRDTLQQYACECYDAVQTAPFVSRSEVS